jgi:hypothetical protein
MRVLYAVFVLSLVALVWTIIAVRRHIRDHDARPAEPLSLNPSGSESQQDDPHKHTE